MTSRRGAEARSRAWRRRVVAAVAAAEVACIRRCCWRLIAVGISLRDGATHAPPVFFYDEAI